MAAHARTYIPTAIADENHKDGEVWVCSACGRRLPHPKVAAAKENCKCGQPYSTHAILAEPKEGASFHRPAGQAPFGASG
jgi:hypothetical protein